MKLKVYCFVKEPFTFKDYFNFNRSERSRILFWLCILLGILLATFAYKNILIPKEIVSWKQMTENQTVLNNEKVADAPIQTIGKYSEHFDKPSETNSSREKRYTDNREDRDTPIFPIDINKASSSDLAFIKGIDRRLASRIIKYRDAKGGYRNIEELTKVYDLSQETFENLKAHVFIPKVPQREVAVVTVLDINTASPDELRALQGIGPVLSERIVKYRDAKGGFRHLDELKDVYGLSIETIENISAQLTLSPPKNDITVTSQAVNETISEKKIPLDLNRATREDLENIRGIGPIIAKGIVERRDRLGGFHSLYQLLTVYAVTPELITQIRSELLISTPVSQFDINAISFKELLRKKILDYDEVKYVFQLKEMQGGISGVGELKRLQGIPKEKIDELIPYIIFPESSEMQVLSATLVEN